MRKIFLIFLFSFLLPFQVFAAPTLLSNTGLVPSNIWFSKDPFYAGDKIRIYSVIFTGSKKDLRGRVNFYDNKTLLCTNEFAALADRVSEVWCDWTVTKGKHAISIQIINPRASSPGEPEEDVVLSNSELKVEERIVEETPEAVAPIDSATGAGPTQSEGVVQKIVNMFYGGNASSSSPGGALTASVVAPADVSPSSTPSYASKVAPIVNSAKEKFLRGAVDLSSKTADAVLPTVKNWTDSDIGPVAYTASFLYKVLEFILRNPLIFAAFGLAAVWWLLHRIFASRDSYDY